VKDIGHFDMDDNIIAEDVIENGVKEVKSVYLRSCLGVGDAIQNGVKHMKGLGPSEVTEKEINNTIQNGVKETKERITESYEQKDHMVTTAEITDNIKDAIENGVKE
jgi:hypothetical protein